MLARLDWGAALRETTVLGADGEVIPNSLFSDTVNTINGLNFANTPCTGIGSLVIALEDRQRLAHLNRPWRIPDRYYREYCRYLDQTYRRLEGIIRAKGIELPDWSTRYKKYTGAKRNHYRKCAVENTLHPLESTPTKLFHVASVKWGELTDRYRALLVQSMRARGGTMVIDGESVTVKEGEVLRLPIMLEGPFCDVLEEALHHFYTAYGVREVAIGMDQFKKARTVHRFVKPGHTVVCVDFSSFDGSKGKVGVAGRRRYLQAMERLFGRQIALRKILEEQDVMRVQAGPLRATIYGNQGSGEAGTALKNKIDALSLMAYACGPAMVGRDPVTILDDGDDLMLDVPERYASPANFRSWRRRLANLGMNVEFEVVVQDTPDNRALWGLRFCRAGVVETGRGPYMCKDPIDAVRTLTNFRRHFAPREIRDYLQTLAVGVKTLFGDVPILGAFAELYDLDGRVRWDYLCDGGLEKHLLRHRSKPVGHVTSESRQSFMLTFGVTPSEQVHCESVLRAAKPMLLAALHAYEDHG